MSTCDVFDAFLLAGAELEVLLRQKPATPGASGAGAGAAGGDLQMEEEALVMVVSVVHSAMLALLYCSRLREGEAEISTVSSSPFGEGGRNRGFCELLALLALCLLYIQRGGRVVVRGRWTTAGSHPPTARSTM